jgi:hypothetical protein
MDNLSQLDHAEEFLAKIRGNGEEMLQLISDLLDTFYVK